MLQATGNLQHVLYGENDFHFSNILCLKTSEIGLGMFQIHLIKKHSNDIQSKFVIRAHLNLQCECTPLTVCQSQKRQPKIHPLGNLFANFGSNFIRFPFKPEDQVDARLIQPETYFEYSIDEMHIFCDVSRDVNFLEEIDGIMNS